LTTFGHGNFSTKKKKKTSYLQMPVNPPKKIWANVENSPLGDSNVFVALYSVVCLQYAVSCKNQARTEFSLHLKKILALNGCPKKFGSMQNIPLYKMIMFSFHFVLLIYHLLSQIAFPLSPAQGKKSRYCFKPFTMQELTLYDPP
jgi:hypothetical protein